MLREGEVKRRFSAQCALDLSAAWRMSLKERDSRDLLIDVRCA